MTGNSSTSAELATSPAALNTRTRASISTHHTSRAPAAYLAAGAHEVWWVELDARVRVFDVTGEVASSTLVDELPVI